MITNHPAQKKTVDIPKDPSWTNKPNNFKKKPKTIGIAPMHRNKHAKITAKVMLLKKLKKI